ncbi:MAG TPA: efflux RND transporter permease subunit [Oligoflexus sp.]|uniref:efflux RND transporter permease subunit n=1 Tax=Oligoflexus sp. TaxID=1971216 RepID=UPI002D3575E2|nr:efflux RND transporter permease subunit [Oligoflexus sp.]HYX38704.1 efflux RND transporter permease subunit [Oligoflexus sp.]
MSLPDISVRRPIFISCIVIVMLVLGYVSMTRLSVELFPDVNPPVVSVLTIYPGTGPKEIETLVTKPIEDAVSTIAGVKRVTSKSMEGVSQIVAEFTMDQDIKRAEQRVRDKVSEAKVRFPDDVKEPVVQAFDFSDQAVVTISLMSKLPEAKLYDLATEIIKPRLQQIPDVGTVTVVGGRRREIQVLLDRDKLENRGFSATYVASRLAESGANIPVGKINAGSEENIFRSKGEFHSVASIGSTVISLYGNDNPTKVADVARVVDTLEEEKNRVYVDGERALMIEIYKQSKTNTVAIAKRVQKELPAIEELVKASDPQGKITLIRDGSREISLNIFDVQESIFLGIVLTIFVVYLFLGNFRSTLITGLAIPNSLLGSFILMQAFGLSINIVTLLALGLVVGLLIDDAIVVRENIFRYLEQGMDPKEAALKGTKEVALAVVATTLVVMSVFGPIALTQGLIGKILANFGLVICFAMAISLFDALTIAPMLSAYFAGNLGHEKEKSSAAYRYTFGAVLGLFERLQVWLEHAYVRLINGVLRFPKSTILLTLAICAACFATVGSISKTFIPTQDAGEFTVVLELPQGTNIIRTDEVAVQVTKVLQSIPEVATVALTVGGNNAEANLANFYVRMKPAAERQRRLAEVKEDVRLKLVPFKESNPKVQDYDFSGGGIARPLTLNILSDNDEELEAYTGRLLAKLRDDPRLKDLDTTLREGKKEFSFELDPQKANIYGLNTAMMGSELRAQVQGLTPTVFRDKGHEYDVRVMMNEKQKDVRRQSNEVNVMNINSKLIRLGDVADIREGRAQASIDRQSRSRYIQISADLAAGVGIGDITADLTKILQEGDLKIPTGMRFVFVGESENFEELSSSLIFVLGLAIMFIFLVLSSLYESFITPMTIILTLPLALCGAFLALLYSNESINLFSGLGMLMLLGVSCKNSILLVDFTNQRLQEGIDLATAIREAGKARLRPILMTSLALIAGSIPIAIGLNEASSQRVSMGIAIIGGVISSTILSLVVVPALLPYFYRLSEASKWLVQALGGKKSKVKSP